MDAYGGGGFGGYNGFEPEPSQQIMVRNVSTRNSRIDAVCSVVEF